jgi:hypothetical protein
MYEWVFIALQSRAIWYLIVNTFLNESFTLTIPLVKGILIILECYLYGIIILGVGTQSSFILGGLWHCIQPMIWNHVGFFIGRVEGSVTKKLLIDIQFTKILSEAWTLLLVWNYFIFRNKWCYFFLFLLQ